MKLYEKLLVIQKNLDGLSKDGKSNNYNYVTGNKIINIVRPLMDELGLILKQEVLKIKNERMDYRTGIGTQYEKPKSEILSKVDMRFTWVDCESGEKDENLFSANGQNEWEKGLGSALTYGERYFLLKFFHVPTDADDIDNPMRKKEISDKQAIAILNSSKTIKELAENWQKISEKERALPTVFAMKEQLKTKLN